MRQRRDDGPHRPATTDNQLECKLPKAVEREIERRKRLYIRQAEREEDWLPLPRFMYALAAIWLFVRAVLYIELYLIVLSALSVGFQLPSLFFPPWVHQTIVRYVPFILGGSAAYLIWGGALPLIQYTLNKRRRNEAWQEAVFYEFASSRSGLAPAYPKSRIAEEHLYGEQFLRPFLRKWSGMRKDQSGQRLRHARRWARLDELRFISNNIAKVYAGFVTVSVLLWYNGWIAGREKFYWLPAFFYSAVHYLWTIAHAIPVLNITETFAWEPPSAFQSDRIQNVMLLLFRIAIIGPIVAYVFHIFTEIEVDVSRQIGTDDEPMSAVAKIRSESFLETKRPRPKSNYSLLSEKAKASGLVRKPPHDDGNNHARIRRTIRNVYAEAARRLNEHKVPSTTGNEWTPTDICKALGDWTESEHG